MPSLHDPARWLLAPALSGLLACASSVAPSSIDGSLPVSDGTVGRDGTSGCPSGSVVCEGRCTNIASNSNNCGGCGMRCNSANQICQGAHCVPAEQCNGGGCSGGMTCCAERICCPGNTRCVEAIPDYLGCCPEGETCN